MESSWNLILLIPVIKVVCQIVLPENNCTDSACYDSAGNIFIDAECTANDVIAIDGDTGIKVGGKRNGTTDDPHGKCFPDLSKDCIQPYRAVSDNWTYSYHNNCNGRRKCIPTRAERTRLNCTGFPDFSEYLYMDFYCIPKTRIGECSFSELTTSGFGSVLYIQNPSYPGSEDNMTCNCKAWTDNSSSVIIHELDVKLEEDGFIRFNDSDDITMVNGGYTNLYAIRTLLNSSSNVVRFDAMLLNGSFWIAISSTEGGELHVQCPAGEQYHLRPVQPSQISPTSLTSEFQWWVILVIVSIVVIVIVIAGIVYKIKQRESQNHQGELLDEDYQENDNSLFKNQESRNILPYATLHDKVFPKLTRPKALEPLPDLYNNGWDDGGRTEEETKKKKKSKKKKKKRKKKNVVDPMCGETEVKNNGGDLCDETVVENNNVERAERKMENDKEQDLDSSQTKPDHFESI